MAARNQPHMTFDHNLFAGLEPLLDHLIHIDAYTAYYWPGFDGHVGLHDKNVVSVLPGLDGSRRNQHGSLYRSEPQRYAYEFARPEGPIFVGKGAFQLDGAGGWIDRIVDKGQFAGLPTSVAIFVRIG